MEIYKFENKVAILFHTTEENELFIRLDDLKRITGKKLNDWAKYSMYVLPFYTGKNADKTNEYYVQYGTYEGYYGTWLRFEYALAFATWCDKKLGKFLEECKAEIEKPKKTYEDYLFEELERQKALVRERDERIQELVKEMQEAPLLASKRSRHIPAVTTYTMTQASKILGLRSVGELITILSEEKIIYKSGGMWLLHADYCNQSYEVYKSCNVKGGKKKSWETTYLVWTPAGIEFLKSIINK